MVAYLMTFKSQIKDHFSPKHTCLLLNRISKRKVLDTLSNVTGTSLLSIYPSTKLVSFLRIYKVAEVSGVAWNKTMSKRTFC